MSSNYEDRGRSNYDDRGRSNYEDRGRSYNGDDDQDRGRGGMQRGGRRMHRRRICRFCIEKVDQIDFKDLRLLQNYTPERGKILPRRISGNCAIHQRMLAEAIKRARTIALLPYTTN
jgi:small subunit ribosomal protein S18